MRLIFIIIILVFGVLLVGFGITLWFVIPKIVKTKINDLLPLQHKTVVYEQWKNTTMPIYMQFWYFNITNGAAIEKGDKPSVTQCGPYTYREYRIKENIVFYDNGSVSYKQRRLFFFDRSKSIGDENDIITTMNIPIVVIGDKLRGKGSIIEEIVAFIVKRLGDPDVLMNVSVGNLTWGYVDPVLEMASKIAALFNIKIDPKLGIFYKKNDTNDGEYLVDNGAFSLNNFLDVRKWRNSDSLPFWNSTISNMINGTDGSMFKPFLTESPAVGEPLYIFQSDICRSIYAVHTSQTVIRGIPAWTFTPPPSVFENSSVNPWNKGFCVDAFCLGSGVLNLSRCVPDNVPIVMSQPQLYQAADHYQADILGLRPSPDCVTTLSIEPTTGLPLDLQKKLQINLAVSAVPGFIHMDRLRSMLVPIVWLNESVQIDATNAALITGMLIVPVRAATGSSIALMALGFVIVVALLIFVLVRSRIDRRYRHINGNEVLS